MATQKVAVDAHAMTEVDLLISQNEQQIDKDTLAIRQLAIVSYMNGGSVLSDSDNLLFGGEMRAVGSGGRRVRRHCRREH